jgi:general stress protein YciG
MKRKNKAAQDLGRKGGKARAKSLSAAERIEIARKAGTAGGRGRKKQ